MYPKPKKKKKVFWTQIEKEGFIQKAPTSFIQPHLCLQHMKFENALLNSLASWPGNDVPDLPWIYHQIQVRSAMWRRNCFELFTVSISFSHCQEASQSWRVIWDLYSSTALLGLHEVMICLITQLSIRILLTVRFRNIRLIQFVPSLFQRPRSYQPCQPCQPLGGGRSTPFPRCSCPTQQQTLRASNSTTADGPKVALHGWHDIFFLRILLKNRKSSQFLEIFFRGKSFSGAQVKRACITLIVQFRNIAPIQTAKLLSWRDFELLNGRLQVGKYPMKVWPFSKKTRILSVKTTSDQGLVTGIMKKRKKRQDGWQAPSSPKRSFSLIGPKLHSYRRKELAAPFRVGEWDRTSWCWWIWHKATTKTMGNTAFLQSPLLFVRPGPEKSPRVEVGKCEFKSRKISMTQPEPLTTFLKKLPFYFQPA